MDSVKKITYLTRQDEKKIQEILDQFGKETVLKAINLKKVKSEIGYICLSDYVDGYICSRLSGNFRKTYEKIYNCLRSLSEFNCLENERYLNLTGDFCVYLDEPPFNVGELVKITDVDGIKQVGWIKEISFDRSGTNGYWVTVVDHTGRSFLTIYNALNQKIEGLNEDNFVDASKKYYA